MPVSVPARAVLVACQPAAVALSAREAVRGSAVASRPIAQGKEGLKFLFALLLYFALLLALAALHEFGLRVRGAACGGQE